MTSREFARQWVAEHYEDRIADELPATEYATLAPEAREKIDLLIEAETDRLQAFMRRAMDAWALDAEPLPTVLP